MYTQNVRQKYAPGPVIGRGGYGLVLGTVDRNTRDRFACKSIFVTELLNSADGPNIVRRLRNEISIMSHLAGHPNVREGTWHLPCQWFGWPSPSPANA